MTGQWVAAVAVVSVVLALTMVVGVLVGVFGVLAGWATGAARHRRADTDARVGGGP